MGKRNGVFKRLVPTWVSFAPLETAALRNIIEEYIDALNQSLIDKQIRVEVAEHAHDFILEFVSSNGANTRGLRGQLKYMITQPIQKFCADNAVYHGDCLQIVMQDEEPAVRKIKILDPDAPEVKSIPI